MAGTWADLAMLTARAYGGPKTAAGSQALALVQLMQQRGAPLPLAAPASSSFSSPSSLSGGVGLRATRALAAGEEVLRVPPALWVPHSSDAALAGAKASAPALLDRMQALEESMRARQRQMMAEAANANDDASAMLASSFSSSSSAAVSVAPLAALAMQLLFRGVDGPDAAYTQWLHAALPV